MITARFGDWLNPAREIRDQRAIIVEHLDAQVRYLTAELARSTAAPPIWFVTEGLTLAVGTVLSQDELDLLIAVLRDARRLLAGGHEP